MGTEKVMVDSVVDVLVVGAGPYGLSVAAHLKGRGVQTRIIGVPMRFWQENMPEGMFLKSEPFASSLGSPRPGGGFDDYTSGWRAGRPIPLGTFLAYGRWFADRLVPETEPDRVTAVERSGTGYTVTLSTGETVAARAVVMAVGVGGFAHVPDEFAGLPAELASHPVAHRDLGRFAGQDVAVVGAGQSALETAALLAESGAYPCVLARTTRLAWNAVPDASLSLVRGPRSGLGRGWRTWLWSERPSTVRFLPERTRRRIVRTTMPPAGAWWLRERLADVPVRLGQHVTEVAAHAGRVVIQTRDHEGQVSRVEADHAITATGYVCDLDRVGVLSPEIRRTVHTRHGYPVLDAGFQSSLPGLYFAGLTAALSFGPVMRFVHGSDFAAARIATHIARTNPSRPMPRVPAQARP
ncbi:SidA/IucD/PvdA family monooxygenase [Actinomadura sp. J1-007]|nr:SidA/IucD/PvdA family monooxygenase [Actinomadura sp. J1-007]